MVDVFESASNYLMNDLTTNLSTNPFDHRFVEKNDHVWASSRESTPFDKDSSQDSGFETT